MACHHRLDFFAVVPSLTPPSPYNNFRAVELLSTSSSGRLAMKQAVKPIPSSFQTFLRAINAEARTQPLLCSSCRRKSQRRHLHANGKARSSSRLRKISLVQTSDERELQRFGQLAPITSRRSFATVQDAIVQGAPVRRSPLEEYDERVHSRKLREDEHQRSEYHIHQGEFHLTLSSHNRTSQRSPRYA